MNFRSLFRALVLGSALLVDPTFSQLPAFLATEPKAQNAAVWRQSATLLTADPATAVARTEQLRVLLTTIRDHGPTVSAAVADYYKRCLLELMIASAVGLVVIAAISYGLLIWRLRVATARIPR